MSLWTQWVDRPEKVWLRNLIFQIHFWIGAAAGAYIFLMSVTGSLLVFRNELSRWPWINVIVAFHANLLAGSRGRALNGAGAISLTVLCLTGAVIWWPGIAHWRRSLTVEWRAHFARVNWDLHSALGFWCFLFVLMWGFSGIYLALPQAFDGLFVLDPRDRYTDAILFWLARLHFGRFGLAGEAVWALVGLVPAVLAFTGVFICCRRVILGKPSNPRVAAS